MESTITSRYFSIQIGANCIARHDSSNRYGYTSFGSVFPIVRGAPVTRKETGNITYGNNGASCGALTVHGPDQCASADCLLRRCVCRNLGVLAASRAVPCGAWRRTAAVRISRRRDAALSGPGWLCRTARGRLHGHGAHIGQRRRAAASAPLCGVARRHPVVSDDPARFSSRLSGRLQHRVWAELVPGLPGAVDATLHRVRPIHHAQHCEGEFRGRSRLARLRAAALAGPLRSDYRNHHARHAA